MRISDWSSDVCSSDLGVQIQREAGGFGGGPGGRRQGGQGARAWLVFLGRGGLRYRVGQQSVCQFRVLEKGLKHFPKDIAILMPVHQNTFKRRGHIRSEEHTSALQSLMRISYAVFYFKKKTKSQSHDKKHNKI